MDSRSIEGFLLINKPSGVTSRYCVNHVVHILRKAGMQKLKVGHAGTLDMFAQGLLIIGVTRSATREIDRIMKLDKRYIANGKLGQWTDTLDYTGQVLQDEDDVSGITREQLQSAVESFGKQYEQMPPLYSALKHQGERLSTLARSKKITPEQLQEIAEKKRRIVQLYSIELVEFSLPFFIIAAHVSHGTYIRTLIDDIAQKVGTHATTHVLERIMIGPFDLEQSQVLSSLVCIEDIERFIIPIDTMIHKIESYTVGD